MSDVAARSTHSRLLPIPLAVCLFSVGSAALGRDHTDDRAGARDLGPIPHGMRRIGAPKFSRKMVARAPPAGPENTRGARRALGPPRAPSPSHPIPQVDGAAGACLCFVAGLGRGSTGIEPGH
jgi:hypothetical protein